MTAAKAERGVNNCSPLGRLIGHFALIWMWWLAWALHCALIWPLYASSDCYAAGEGIVILTLLPAAAAPFPSLWRPNFSRRARLVGLLCGELVAFLGVVASFGAAAAYDAFLSPMDKITSWFFIFLYLGTSIALPIIIGWAVMNRCRSAEGARGSARS